MHSNWSNRIPEFGQGLTFEEALKVGTIPGHQNVFFCVNCYKTKDFGWAVRQGLYSVRNLPINFDYKTDYFH